MNIRRKFFVTYLGIAMVPIMLLSVLMFLYTEKYLKTEVFTKLQSIADLKVKTIQAIFNELERDMAVSQSYYNVKTNLPKLVEYQNDMDAPAYRQATEMLDNQIKPFQKAKGFLDFMLISPKGTIVYSSDDGHRKTELGTSLPFSDLKKMREGIWYSDIVRINNRLEIMIIAPVYDFDDKFAGFIGFDVDMEPIYKIIQDITGLGSTGETLIGTKTDDGALFLNTLRFDKDAALKRTAVAGMPSAAPMLDAVQGHNGEGIEMDYRDIEVISAWRYIPYLDWGLVAKIDTQEAFSVIAQMRHITIALVALTFLLSIVFSLMISRSFSAPIKELQKGTDIIGRGDLDYKVSIKSSDEIGKLSVSFDQMTDNLKKSMASRDELNKANRELERVNEKLKEFDRLKSQFVANVSHEFKNPLSTINMSLESVIGERFGKITAEQKKMLGYGKQSIERLIRMVRDLLDLSTIESGKVAIRRQSVDMLSFASEILAGYDARLSDKECILKKDLDPDIGTVWCDKDRIYQVINNLFDNALKYTTLGGEITVTLKGYENEIRFEIADKGTGIPGDSLEKIFDKFERITAERFEGTGLGLPIAKDIITLHKGKIWAESKLMEGSTFIFTMPRDFRKKSGS
ncbi:ATP-binding protein [Candidatus Auribacterota bacterium]